MRTEELDYHLPAELIATRPAEPRDAARLLVAQREGDAWRIEHRHVRDLTEYVTRDDLMVFNTSRVLPARIEGTRVSTGGSIEGLFLDELTVGTWRVMLRSGGRLREGDAIQLGEGVTLTLEQRDDDAWRANVEPAMEAARILERIGRTPLPPYILKARGASEIADEADRRWYQTVYAGDQSGSVAAPTAGLHFTPELLAKLDAAGTKRASILLHVGPGTFKPVTADTLAEHTMHEERFTVPTETVAAIREHRRKGRGRVIAVGTTTVRALESVATDITACAPSAGPIEGRTRLLIAPPHEFNVVDALLTNFHLPRSTLLALVAAMLGREAWRPLYEEAVRERYRFYSYGDAMLILP